MKLINWTLFSLIALLAAPQAVWAITPANNGGSTSAPLTNTTGTIERGGTVTAVNLQRGTITVDGVTYPLATTLTTGVPPGLKKNMRIRFTTIKNSVTGKQTVSAIVIAN